MKINRLLLMLSITAIVSILLTYSFYQTNKVYSTKELKMDLIIGNYIGINIDTDAVHFGTILPGLSSNREIQLNLDKNVRVNLKISGNISQFITLSENNFMMNNTKTLKLTAKTPLNATKGTYTGTLKITFLNKGII